eukprot:1159833-Pelagomonas_calceolata.AAC.2
MQGKQPKWVRILIMGSASSFSVPRAPQMWVNTGPPSKNTAPMPGALQAWYTLMPVGASGFRGNAS